MDQRVSAITTFGQALTVTDHALVSPGGYVTDAIAAQTVACDDGWFVVWTASRAEKRVESRIAALGIEVWLPTVTEKRRWSDRWQELVTPLFPGYLFARAGAANWPRVLRTLGVVTVVREGERPALLTDDFVTSLRHAIERDSVAVERVSECAEYVPGDEVIVQDGILAGVAGIVRQQRGSRQLVIWVPEIGGGVALTIGTAAVLHRPNAATRNAGVPNL